LFVLISFTQYCVGVIYCSKLITVFLVTVLLSL
jgi:hypothetical protein